MFKYKVSSAERGMKCKSQLYDCIRSPFLSPPQLHPQRGRTARDKRVIKTCPAALYYSQSSGMPMKGLNPKEPQRAAWPMTSSVSVRGRGHWCGQTKQNVFSVLSLLMHHLSCMDHWRTTLSDHKNVSFIHMTLQW